MRNTICNTEMMLSFLNSYSREFTDMITSYIGRLGWGDTQLPNWFVLINYIIIIVLALSVNEMKLKFNMLQRTVFVLVFLGLTLFIMLSQYLTWDKIGSDKVYPLQGRYFIPVFPLIFLILYNTKLNIPIRSIKSVFIFSYLLLAAYTISFFYHRFYYNYQFENRWNVFQDADQINDNKGTYVVEGTDTIVKVEPLIQTEEKSHSGKYSVKLSSQHPFGFTHEVYGAKKGDRIKASVWRHGKTGSIVISEFAKDGVYSSASNVFEKEDSGWQHLETEFFVPRDMLKTELRIYIYYAESDSSYFDDFRISYDKKK